MSKSKLKFFLVVSFFVIPWLEATTKHRLGDLPEQAPTPKDTPSKQPVESSTEKDKSTTEGLTIEQNKKLKEEVAEEFYQKGLKSLNEGNLEQAEAFFDRVLILKPNHKGAQDGIDFIMQAYETPKPKPVENDPKIELAKKLEANLESALNDEDYEEANNIAAEILATDPSNATVKKNLVLINKKLYAQAMDRAAEREAAGDFRGAIDAIQVAMGYRKDISLKSKIAELREKIVEKNKTRSADLYLKALAKNQEAKTEEALALCKQALSLDPQNIQAQRMLERLEPKTR